MGGPIAHFSRVVPTSWGVIRRLAYHVDYGISNVKLALAELGGNTAIVGEAAAQWVKIKWCKCFASIGLKLKNFKIYSEN